MKRSTVRLPTVRPVAVKRAFADVEKTKPAAPVGSASSTEGGIVNLPALMGALQTAAAPAVHKLSVQPFTSITTFPLPPPVQVTVIPSVRFTVALFTGLTRVGDAGMVMVALKAPTSAPPVPVTVYVPGVRNVPAVPMAARLWFVGTDKLPLGPFTVTVEPPSRVELSVTGK